MDQLLNHLLILSLFLMRMTTGDNLTSTGNQMLQDLLAKSILFKESQFQPVLPLKDHAKKESLAFPPDYAVTVPNWGNSNEHW